MAGSSGEKAVEEEPTKAFREKSTLLSFRRTYKPKRLH
ncbi:hypothetical protein HKBW3S42_02430, partial [Candidatus Hakubella thermalkaliphila]